MAFSEQIHNIKTSGQAFIEVRTLPPTRGMNDDKIVQIHSAIGGSGIMQRLDRTTVLELITALAECAGVEPGIINIYSEQSDE